MATARPLTDLQSRFLDWLIKPESEREPESQAAWCAANRVHENTPRKWKADANFRAHWEKRLAELKLNPSRIQEVVDAMFAKAAKGDTRAAAIVFRYLEWVMPRKVTAADVDDPTELSDEELEAALDDDVAPTLDDPPLLDESTQL